MFLNSLFKWSLNDFINYPNPNKNYSLKYLDTIKEAKDSMEVPLSLESLF